MIADIRCSIQLYLGTICDDNKIMYSDSSLRTILFVTLAYNSPSYIVLHIILWHVIFVGVKINFWRGSNFITFGAREKIYRG